MIYAPPSAVEMPIMMSELVKWLNSDEDIRRDYPGGFGELADGGTWNTIAGQPIGRSAFWASPDGTDSRDFALLSHPVRFHAAP